jgi:hypothetical protein
MSIWSGLDGLQKEASEFMLNNNLVLRRYFRYYQILPYFFIIIWLLLKARANNEVLQELKILILHLSEKNKI